MCFSPNLSVGSLLIVKMGMCFSPNMSVGSLLIVKMGKGVTVVTGGAAGEPIPAWTTQRAPQNYWDTYRYPTWTLRRDPVADTGKLCSTVKQLPSADGPVRFQLRCEMMRFVLFSSVRRSTHLLSICSIVHIRCEG